MSTFPWHASYPASVPHEINPDVYPSLIDLLEDCFKQFADLDAYENMGKRMTYRQLDEQSKIFASFLQNELKLQPGDRIAIQMPNVLQFPIVLFGAIRAGITVVNTNPLYTPTEMRHQFNDSGAKAVVILANFASNLEEILKETPIEHVIVTEIGDQIGGLKGMIVNFVVKHIKKMVPAYSLPKALSYKSVMKSANPAHYKRPQIASDHNAFLQYTGGTTGVSKGAMLTHRNMVANLEQVSGWMGTSNLVVGREIFITALPLYHIFALTVNAFLCAKLGAKSLLITNPRDMKGFVKELSKQPYTFITGVNTLFNGLLNAPGFAEVDHSKVKVAIAGGMALQRFVAEKWKAVTGVPVAEGYGLTECTTAASTNTHEAYRFGTVGRPLPGTEVKLAEDGELLIRSETVFQGYYKEPEATAEVLGDDGWLRTGDIAEIDEDGFVKITDRKKDIIVTAGGKNVAPQNLENDLKSSKFVSQAMVVGDRQPYIAALLTLDPEALSAWAEERGLPADMESLAASPEVRELVQGIVDEVNADRSRYEQIKRFTILPRDFTMEHDELTPTLKLKRRVVAEHFGDRLDELYEGETLKQLWPTEKPAPRFLWQE